VFINFSVTVLFREAGRRHKAGRCIC
jgi:hypothetical protein